MFMKLLLEMPILSIGKFLFQVEVTYDKHMCGHRQVMLQGTYPTMMETA